MKIFVFKYDNCFSGKRNFKVLAESRDEAWDFLQICRKKYIMDDDTCFLEEETIELDSIKMIAEL